MINGNRDDTRLAPTLSNGLIKLGNAFKITEKILYEGAERLFNEAFYLINSKHLQNPCVNFYFLIKSDKQFLFKNKLKLIANSDDDYKKAIELFTKAIELKPDFKSAYYFRGVTKSKLKDDEGAMADFTKAIEADSSYENAYVSRGNVKTKLRDYDGAIDDYTKAIDLDPNDALLYFRRGIAKTILRDYDEAIADFTKTINIDANYANAFFGRGTARKNSGDIEGAEADFRIYRGLNQ